jgi:hypothetical protein
MNRLLDGRDHLDRRHGAAAMAAGDGLEGSYSATLHAAPSAGTVKVIIPALGLTLHRTAVCSSTFTGSPGDRVLVTFDEQKQPWVVATLA